MYSLYLSVSLATLVSASPFKTTNTCADFTAGACDLSETNIVDHNRFTDTPEECQVPQSTVQCSQIPFRTCV